MIMTEGDTTVAIDEDTFIELSTTSPLSRFNLTALRLMYRWYQRVADEAGSEIAYDPYEMTRAWRELDGKALVAEYGLPGERNADDAATIDRVVTRLNATTAVIEVAADYYLVLAPAVAAAMRR